MDILLGEPSKVELLIALMATDSYVMMLSHAKGSFHAFAVSIA